MTNRYSSKKMRNKINVINDKPLSYLIYTINGRKVWASDKNFIKFTHKIREQLSRELNFLKEKGYLKSNREGKRTYYSVNENKIIDLFFEYLDKKIISHQFILKFIDSSKFIKFKYTINEYKDIFTSYNEHFKNELRNNEHFKNVFKDFFNGAKSLPPISLQEAYGNIFVYFTKHQNKYNFDLSYWKSLDQWFNEDNYPEDLRCMVKFFFICNAINLNPIYHEICYVELEINDKKNEYGIIQYNNTKIEKEIEKILNFNPKIEDLKKENKLKEDEINKLKKADEKWKKEYPNEMSIFGNTQKIAILKNRIEKNKEIIIELKKSKN